MEILRVENLTKVYGKGENEVRALDGVSRASDGRAEDRRREVAALRQELVEMREEWEAWQR